MGFRNVLLSSLLGLAGLCVPIHAKAGETPVYRDTVALSTGLSIVNIADEDYESGAFFNLSGSVVMPVSGWLSLNPKLNATYTSHGLLEKNASEELKYADLSLEARLKLGFGYLSVGTEYLLDDEMMNYQDASGHVKRHSLGPVMSFSVEHPNVDASLSVSELFGYRSSSYDQRRLIRTQHVALAVAVRSKLAEIRTAFEFSHSTVADFPKDRENFLIKFMFQPGIDVTPHLSFFPYVAYTQVMGIDEYVGNEAGLGSRIKW